MVPGDGRDRRASTGALGIPDFAGGTAKAPYDILGDTMRGTRGAMLDKFRRPAELIEAMERLVPIAIDGASRAADERQPVHLHAAAQGRRRVPLGQGLQELYWPTLKAVIVGLIAEGLVPQLFVEGSFDSRLDVIVDDDIPAGRTVWLFDATDMTAVRDRFRGFACFGGNVPGALLSDRFARRRRRTTSRGLLADVGRRRRLHPEHRRGRRRRPAENFAAMMEAGRRYGG